MENITRQCAAEVFDKGRSRFTLAREIAVVPVGVELACGGRESEWAFDGQKLFADFETALTGEVLLGCAEGKGYWFGSFGSRDEEASAREAAGDDLFFDESGGFLRGEAG